MMIVVCLINIDHSTEKAGKIGFKYESLVLGYLL